MTFGAHSDQKISPRLAKKEAREARAGSARLMRILRRVSYSLVAIAVVIGGGSWVVNAYTPKGPDFSKAVELLGREHIAEGTSYAGYNSNPPTSGSHYPSPAPVRFYDRELPDEQVVHNLEHGNVWIAYQPDIPSEAIKQLRGIAGGIVIVTPRERNDADIALAAWGRLDTFDLPDGAVDTQRITDFILRYQNKGPENPAAFAGHAR